MEIIEINFGSGLYPVACLVSYSESENTQQLGTTTRQNNDGWKTSFGTFQGKTISGNALFVVDESGASVATYEDLLELKRARNEFQYRIDDELGLAILTNLALSGGTDDDIGFTFEMIVQGEPSIV